MSCTDDDYDVGLATAHNDYIEQSSSSADTSLATLLGTVDSNRFNTGELGHMSAEVKGNTRQTGD